jgi:hypothetical protein
MSKEQTQPGGPSPYSIEEPTLSSVPLAASHEAITMRHSYTFPGSTIAADRATIGKSLQIKAK